MEKSEYGIFDSIDETYQFLCNAPRNERGRNSIKWIGHYLSLLYEYASECEHITEFGINQCVSTWAFLMARPTKLVSIDKDLHGNPIKPCDSNWKWTENNWLNSAIDLAKKSNISFDVIEDNTLTCTIEETDLLFIDTTHNYDHMYAELLRHKDKVRRYIILHDTSLFPTINTAINQLLIDSGEFVIINKQDDEPGLTVCMRSK